MNEDQKPEIEFEVLRDAWCSFLDGAYAASRKMGFEYEEEIKRLKGELKDRLSPWIKVKVGEDGK